ncbi:MAG: sigma-70 family RNA polymerase sigma factor [Myxococcota bacterium]
MVKPEQEGAEQAEERLPGEEIQEAQVAPVPFPDEEAAIWEEFARAGTVEQADSAAQAHNPRRVPEPETRMSAAEEYELARVALGKGAEALEARNKLVMANYGLIHMVAQAYRRAGIRYEDLVQEGAMGLLRAAETFDPERGVRFGTYAVYWIRSKVQRYIEHQRRETNPFMAGVASVEGEDGRRHIPRTRTMSLETPLDAEGERTLSETVSNPDEVTPERRAIEGQEEDRVVREVWEACKQLGDPRLEVIVKRRLLSKTPETLAQVGRRLKLSREGARLLEARVLSLARERLKDLGDARS